MKPSWLKTKDEKRYKFITCFHVWSQYFNIDDITFSKTNTFKDQWQEHEREAKLMQHVHPETTCPWSDRCAETLPDLSRSNQNFSISKAAGFIPNLSKAVLVCFCVSPGQPFFTCVSYAILISVKSNHNMFINQSTSISVNRTEALELHLFR